MLVSEGVLLCMKAQLASQLPLYSQSAPMGPDTPEGLAEERVLSEHPGPQLPGQTGQGTGALLL